MKNTLRYLLTTLVILTGAFYSQTRAQIIKGEVILGANVSQVEGDECYRYRQPGIHVGAGALIPITNYLDIGIEVLFDQKGAYKKDSVNMHLGLFSGKYDLRLNYAEIPVMVYLTDKDQYSIGLGFSYGRLVGLDEKVNGVSTSMGIGDGNLHWKVSGDNLPDLSQVTDFDQLSELVYSSGFPPTEEIETLVPSIIANSNTYRPSDFSILADLKVRLHEGLHAELRYQYSLVPIRTRLFYKDVNETILKTDDRRVNPVQRQRNDTITLRLVYVFNEQRSKMNRKSSAKQY